MTPLSLELYPSPDEEGIYEADLTVTSPGSYRVEATAHLGETTLGSDTRHFRREDGVAENFRPEQNRELLEKLAEQTGGRYWTLEQVSGLPDEIRFSKAGITSREIMDLWDMPAFFILLLSLRAAEWLLQTQMGPCMRSAWVVAACLACLMPAFPKGETGNTYFRGRWGLGGRGWVRRKFCRVRKRAGGSLYSDCWRRFASPCDFRPKRHSPGGQ